MKKILFTFILLVLLAIGAGALTRQAMGWNDGMTQARSEIHAATLDGKLYIAGGIGLFRVLDSCEVLDLTMDIWTSCGRLPRPLHHVAMAADDTHVYASGGYVSLPFNADPEAGLFRFDPEAGQWTEISKLPHPIGQHSMTHFDGGLFLIGGQDSGRDLDTVWRYDIAADRWEAMASMPTARHSHAIAKSGSQLFVTGGRSAALGTEIRLIEIYDLAENSWTKGPDMPTGRGGHGAAVASGRLHILGGESLTEGRLLPDHDILDLATDSWIFGPEMSQPRHGFAIGEMAGQGGLTIIGGGARVGIETIYSVTGTVQRVGLE
ncbi:N-acetylneuraminic acid mutarotase [Parasphingorhabdus marina DSM 22363]|uniref:N-acetylneuraminic acid mutarotase n=1 Tax=Parasphingorhabdus marina DSM 22363 TaxID=1123272 RepID=A0A1N6CVS8_9SPHN|nr:kelch repeat-containing protein [Parasphingorhabdus marina]SIN62577.1 N-acetylneuraminic acid mutarotase [Parasphingorhabdus marina DSM 22363]